MKEPPPLWGKDDLSAFIDNAIDNTFATFANKKEIYALLAELDGCFQTLIPNMTNRPEVVPVMLLARSHSSYRAAARLAMSGQCADTFPLLRSSIECALYGFRVGRNPTLEEVWLRRHDDDQSLMAVKQEFSYKAVRDELEAVDPTLSQLIDALYQRCIDYGAHPNERSVTSQMEINEREKAIEYMLVYLTGDGTNLLHALKSTAQVGLRALYVYRHLFTERFDLLGVTEKIDRMRGAL